MDVHGKKEIGIYAHIPFCAVKCPYCDFASVASSVVPERRYVECLLRELRAAVDEGSPFAGPFDLRSIYMGGGTPSIFSPSSIGAFIEEAGRNFSGSGAEVTIEANPADITMERLTGYLRAGVNRISIGAQSFVDSDLSTLGRRHDSRRAEESFREARRAGFENIAIDLIFGIPGQTLQGWKTTLQRAMELRAEHLSLYNLSIEEGTPFHGLYGKGKGMAEEIEVEMFETARALLAGRGYVHYEISNYCLEGRMSVHNSGYWSARSYLGVGSGAHSFINSPRWGRRTWNIKDPRAYMEGVEKDGGARAGCEELGEKDAMLEALMLGLRMPGRGVCPEEFASRFGRDPFSLFSGAMDELEARGLLRRNSGAGGGGGRITLADEALVLTDTVISELARCI